MILVTGLLAAAAAGPAIAQSYYDVEVVVFELLNSNAVPNVPPSASANAAPGVSVAAGASTSAETATTAPAPEITDVPGGRFELLPADRLLLKPEYQQLRSSKSYRPLLHQGWRQQVLGPRASVPRTLLEQTGAGLLSGDVKVYAETYLHIDLDLSFDVPGEGIFRLRDSRRVRSKETHYFDSARFGVLIRLTPS
jgi:hypothetical protein